MFAPQVGATGQYTQLAQRNLSEGQRKLHVHKGRNTILLELYNGTNLMFFSVVLAPAG